MSGMFAAIMKDYQRAILVGEETGGLANPHGSNVAVTLPESKFRFTISTSRAYRPSGVFDNRGVIPDIAVPFDDLSTTNTIDELLELTDRGR
jgi:C-terminal processing protease CtpA/Prc